MALNPKFSTQFANTIFTAAIDNVFDSGFLDIYDGTKPATADATEGSANRLARVDLPAAAFATSASGGVLAKLGTWQEAAAILNGTAVWFRLRESSDTGGASTTKHRIDGTVGITAGQFDLVLTSVNIIAGDPVEIDTFDLILPI